MIDPLTKYLFRNSGQHGPIVLMYHSVERDVRTTSWPWSLPLCVFNDHLDLLRDHGWSTRTIEELISNPPEELPSKTAVLTFDDGFENNLDALDALVARGMRATWFIVTGAIGKTPHWEDSGRPHGKILSAKNLCEMNAAGMEIGSHTISHRRLTQLSETEIAKEVSESKNDLQQILGQKVKSFAYPYGAWSDESEAAIRKAGYSGACTTRTGPAFKDDCSFQLRRLSIYRNDSKAYLARKLTLIKNEGTLGQLADYGIHRLGEHLTMKKLGLHR